MARSSESSPLACCLAIRVARGDKHGKKTTPHCKTKVLRGRWAKPAREVFGNDGCAATQDPSEFLPHASDSIASCHLPTSAKESCSLQLCLPFSSEAGQQRRTGEGRVVKSGARCWFHCGLVGGTCVGTTFDSAPWARIRGHSLGLHRPSQDVYDASNDSSKVLRTFPKAASAMSRYLVYIEFSECKLQNDDEKTRGSIDRGPRKRAPD